MTTYSNNKSKKTYKKYKKITTILKSFDTIVSFATTTSSCMMSLTGIGLIAIPLSTATVCGLSIGNKLKYEIFINKYKKYKKKMQKVNKQLNLPIIYTENLYKII